MEVKWYPFSPNSGVAPIPYTAVSTFYQCAKCGTWVNGSAHVCHPAPTSAPPVGWVCPVCSAGVAPHVDRCPCKAAGT